MDRRIRPGLAMERECANPACRKAFTIAKPSRSGQRFCSRECARYRPPLFIVCANEACGIVKQVKRRADQGDQHFCSHSCAATVKCNLTSEGARRGGTITGHRRRVATAKQLEGLTPMQIFRLAWHRGFERAKHQIRKKYDLIPRKTAAA